MPSSINVNGRITRRPGVYGEADASALAGRAAALNVVAVVGEWPFLAKATPTKASSAQALLDLARLNKTLGKVAKALYEPAFDDRVAGGPTAVVLVGVQPTTAALLTLLDAGGDDSVVLTSLAYGPDGNRTQVTNIANATDATLRDITIARDGTTEEFDACGSGSVASFWYDGSEAAAVTLAYSIAGGIVIEQTRTQPIGTFNPSELAWDGTIECTPSLGQGVGETGTLTITGINKATGAPLVSVLTWNNADGVTPKTTADAFSDVSEITWASTDGGYAGTMSLVVDAFNLTVSDYATVADAVDRVNGFNAQEYWATADSPRVGAIGLDELDLFIAATILTPAAKKSLRADVWDILRRLGNSALVSAARATGVGNGDTIPAVWTGVKWLAGGTAPSAGGTDWDDAFTALRTQDVQIIVPLTSDQSNHAKLRAHCTYMAGVGGNPCNGWIGVASKATKSTILAAAKSLNTRHVSLVFQDALWDSPEGVREYIEPFMYALMHAGIQAGTPTGTPPTRKFPAIYGVSQNAAIDPDVEVEDFLESGVVITTTDPRLGWKIERSITTYLTDDNPIWSEVSANESVNTSIRDLQAYLDIVIGDPGVKSTRGRIRSIAISRLREQTKEDTPVIKDFLEDSVDVRDLGDRYSIDYVCAAIEPINFVTARASVRRLPAAG